MGSNSFMRAIALGLAGTFIASCSSSSASGTSEPPRAPAVVAVTGKGDPTGTPTQGTIGTAGGKLTSSDGALTINVPPGALTADTSIGIQPITNLVPGAVGASYRLTPEGQVFATPAQLVFKVTDADLAGTALPAIHVAYHDDKGQWRSLKSVNRDGAAHTVTVATPHFSDWAKTAGLKLTPPSASIQPGQSVNLRLDSCEAKDDPTDPELSQLVLTCVQVAESAVWAANGVAGGDGASGTVTEVHPGDAAYVSPNVTPAKNPVAVSAEVAQTDGSKLLVVSNITVGGHPSFTGTSRTDTTIDGGSSGITKTVVDASVRWTWDETDNVYHATGSLEIHYDYTAPTCTTTAQQAGVVSGRDGTLSLIDFGSGTTSYTGSGITMTPPLTGTSTCNDTHTPEPAPITAGPFTWWQPGYMPLPTDGGGKIIAGHVTSAPGAIPSTDAQWSFTQE
jgi:hypothetical protein